MKRRINSTGRRRIERRHVELAVRAGPDAKRSVVAAQFRLDDLSLPSEGRLVVEAYRHAFTERLDYGTVGDPRPPREPVLQELEPDGLLFRIKVVEPSSGRLLALARNVRAGEDATRRRELFRVRTADLGQEVWRVEVDEADAPALVLNNWIPDVAARLHEPTFRALVLPAAMRTVLLELWRAEVEPDEEEPAEDSWSRRWLDFAAGLVGEEAPDADDARSVIAWIDRACAEFARNYGLLDGLLKAEAGAEP